MGSASSKVDSLEDVARCKARKQYIRQAVSCFYAHAAAHFAYVEALKNMGAALQEFAKTDLLNPSSAVQVPRPPPRPPHHVDALIRSPTLPASILQKQLPSSSQRSIFNQLTAHPTKTQTLETIGQLECIQEQQEEEEEGSLADEQLHEKQEHEWEECWEGVDEEEDWGDRTVVDKVELKNKMTAAPSRKVAVILTAPKTGTDFVDAILKVDDLFLKTHLSGMNVAFLLEVHHQTDSVDRGVHGHLYKLLNVIFCGNLHSMGRNQRAHGTKEPESQASHASIIDRLSECEKKLYDEVKGFETIRLTYERECAELLQLESMGRDTGLGKMRASIKSLNRRIKSTLQNVNTTSLEIATLRDDKLYHRLLDLLYASTNMWLEMCDNHQEQTAIVGEPLKADLFRSVGSTCDRHMVSTRQLEDVVKAWHNTFKELIPTQKKYLENLNVWLRLSLIPLETASGEKMGHQADLPTSVIPIYKLCQEWHQALEKLPIQMVLEAMNSFAALVHGIVQLHVEELKHKKRADALARQRDKKVSALQNYESRYLEATAVVDEKQDLLVDPLKKRKNAIAELSKRVDDEKESFAKAVQDSRNMTRQIFSSGLPSLFQAVTSFSSICSDTYKGLHKHLPTEGLLPRLLHET